MVYAHGSKLGNSHNGQRLTYETITVSPNPSHETTATITFGKTAEPTITFKTVDLTEKNKDLDARAAFLSKIVSWNPEILAGIQK